MKRHILKELNMVASKLATEPTPPQRPKRAHVASRLIAAARRLIVSREFIFAEDGWEKTPGGKGKTERRKKPGGGYEYRPIKDNTKGEKSQEGPKDDAKGEKSQEAPKDDAKGKDDATVGKKKELEALMSRHNKKMGETYRGWHKAKKELDSLKADLDKQTRALTDKLKGTRHEGKKVDFVTIRTPSTYSPNVPGVQYPNGKQFFVDKHLSLTDINKRNSTSKKYHQKNRELQSLSQANKDAQAGHKRAKKALESLG